MILEQQLQAFKGKRIIFRNKTHLVKSAKKINSKYLFITDQKTMNLDEKSAKFIVQHAIVIS